MKRMIERIAQGKLTWVSMKNPSSEEVRSVMTEFSLSPLLMGDLTTPIPKNYAMRVEDAIKVVLDFPVVKRLIAQHSYEVKFIIKKDSLITIQYEEMGGMDRFKRQMEVASTLFKKKSPVKRTGADLFITLINHLYASSAEKLDYIETKLTDIEDEIFKDNEKEMVFEISNTSKKLIAFRHTLNGQRDIFFEIAPLFTQVYKHQFSKEISDIQEQYDFLCEKANTLSETLVALRDTNTAMLTTKQNEVMQIFTIMAFVTFPLTLMSSLFGMNTENTPFVGNEWDFWIIVGIMLVAAICFFAFFRHKNWI